MLFAPAFLLLLLLLLLSLSLSLLIAICIYIVLFFSQPFLHSLILFPSLSLVSLRGNDDGFGVWIWMDRSPLKINACRWRGKSVKLTILSFSRFRVLNPIAAIHGGAFFSTIYFIFVPKLSLNQRIS